MGTEAGVYIDDIIVGFAGRGEMVTGVTTPNTAYFAVPTNPNPGAPGQSLVGPYNLEIRTGTTYADEFSMGPDMSAIALTSVFNINDRLSQSISLVAPSSVAQITNNETFTISDGLNTATFQFITGNQVASSTNIPVSYKSGWTGSQIANAIVTAINGQSTVNVQAANADPLHLTSSQVNLFARRASAACPRSSMAKCPRDSPATICWRRPSTPR